MGKASPPLSLSLRLFPFSVNLFPFLVYQSIFIPSNGLPICLLKCRLLAACLLEYLSICLSVHLPSCRPCAVQPPSVHSSVRPYIHHFVYMSFCPSIYFILSISLSFRPIVRPSVHPSICLSVHPFVRSSAIPPSVRLSLCTRISLIKGYEILTRSMPRQSASKARS